MVKPGPWAEPTLFHEAKAETYAQVQDNGYGGITPSTLYLWYIGCKRIRETRNGIVCVVSVSRSVSKNSSVMTRDMQ